MAKGLTPQQCAEVLGCSKDQVLDLITAGELSAFNVGLGKQRARYRVDASELDAFKRRRAVRSMTTRKRRPSVIPTREWV